MVRVLIVEDSGVVREFLQHILDGDPDIEVVGAVGDGETALTAVERLRPDVITMDIHMPRMDGYEASRQIMERMPTPIVIVSGSASRAEVIDSFRALENGALAVLARPVGMAHPHFDEEVHRLRDTVKVMSEVKVVRRWPRADSGRMRPLAAAASHGRQYRIVVIGASTGGPVALHDLLNSLKAPFPLPIVVVQHMAVGFLPGFVEWLNYSTHHTVVLAQDGVFPKAGMVYVAPDHHRISLGRRGQIQLREAPGGGNGRITPSVSDLFGSLAEHRGEETIAILLSGMGTDGAAELKALKERGAYTMAQDRASCAVFGMPGEAVRLAAVDTVAPPDELARRLNAIA